MSDTSPAVILVSTAGTQVGTSASPIFVSGSAVTPSVTINNYIIEGAAGPQGPTGSQGQTGPEGPTTPVTGSWRDPGNAFVTTGSVTIDSQDRTASQIGSDVFFFVSGSITSSSGANRKVTVFGGDTVVSGSVTSVSGLSGSLQRTTDNLSYLVAGANSTITSASNGQVTITCLTTASVGPAVAVTGSWRDAGNAFITTGSVSIDTDNRAVSALGSDIFFFVSGSQDVPSGATRKVTVFGGDTVISGTILQKNLTARPTVAPVSGCLLYTFRGVPYKFTSSSLHQSIGDSYSTITIPAVGTYTLSVDEYTSTIIKVNGTATGAVTIIVPLAAGYRWTFYINSLSTSYSQITIKGATGTGTLALPVTAVDASYPDTLTVSVFADGTNVIFIENSFDNWTLNA